jgi:hypothetical protein
VNRLGCVKKSSVRLTGPADGLYTAPARSQVWFGSVFPSTVYCRGRSTYSSWQPETSRLVDSRRTPIDSILCSGPWIQTKADLVAQLEERLRWAENIATRMGVDVGAAAPVYLSFQRNSDDLQCHRFAGPLRGGQAGQLTRAP